MSYEKTNGIIIKEVNLGEADKIVTIFCRTQGRISAFAKGSRRPKSRLVAGTQFLCYSDFILFKGKDMYSINSCDVIDPFYEIRNDMEKLTYAAHIVDLVNDTVQENQPASRVIQLFLNTLHVLAKTDKPPELISRIFEFRLLSILGYAPHVQGCIECSSNEFLEVYFSFNMCGFLCKNCHTADKSAKAISIGTAKALNYIIYTKIQDLFSFKVSEDILYELGKLSRRYIRERLERDYTKLDFLKML